MKKTILRKIAAITLALAVAMTMGVNVFAADQESLKNDTSLKPGDNNAVISNAGVSQDGQDVGGDDAGKYGVYSPVKNTVRINKEVVIFNTRGSGNEKVLVYLPNITYKYKIEAVSGIYDATADDNATITDEYMLSASVRDGEASAIVASGGNLADLVYSNESGVNRPVSPTTSNPYVLTNNDGVTATGYVDIAFQLTNGGSKTFKTPGVYRYKITESTADNARKAAGVTNKDYQNVRYLDVYVQNKAGSTTGELEIYGYAMYEPDPATQKESFKARENKDAAVKLIPAKSNGFVSDKTDGNAKTSDTAVTTYSKTEAGVDIYETDNVKILKNITGAMGDKTNAFPFAATFKNSDVTSGAKFCYKKFEKGASISELDTANNATALDNSGEATIGSAAQSGTPALKDGEFIYAYGVPSFNETTKASGWTSFAKTTVNFKEYNNTADTYDVSATYNTAAKNVKTDAGTGTTAKMADKKTAELEAAENFAYRDQKTEEEIEVTNSMNAISPTNVVTRYAPFLLILAAAILLLVVRRRRSSEEA